jgi:hypothetical protein
MKYISTIIILILIASILSITFYNQPKACFKQSCINLELTKTQEKRTQGLMYKTELKNNLGILFIYEEEGLYNIWMKNTLIPLDIIWIDQNFQIKQIEKANLCEIEECKTYNALYPTKYIIEVNQGFTIENNIKVGDIITLRNY